MLLTRHLIGPRLGPRARIVEMPGRLDHRHAGKDDPVAAQLERDRDAQETGASTPALDRRAGQFLRNGPVARMPEPARLGEAVAAPLGEPVREQVGVHRAEVV
jgi:hypothetical protein